MRKEATAENKRIGRKLKSRRESLHLTVKQLSEMTGISMRSITFVEGGYEVNFSTMNNYVKGLGGIIEIIFPKIEVETFKTKSLRELKKNGFDKLQ